MTQPPTLSLSRLLLGLFWLVASTAACDEIDVPIALRWVDSQNNQISIESSATGTFTWKKGEEAPFVPAINLSVEIPDRLKLLSASAPALPKPAPAGKNGSHTQLLSFSTTSPLVSFRFSQEVQGQNQSVGLVIELRSFTEEPLMHHSCRDAGLFITKSSKSAYLFSSLSCVNSADETRVFITTSEDAFLTASSEKKQTDTFRIRRDDKRRTFEKEVRITNKSTNETTSFSIGYDSNQESLLFLTAYIGPSVLAFAGTANAQAALALRAKVEFEARLSTRISATGTGFFDLLSLAPSVNMPSAFGVIGLMPAAQLRFADFQLYAGVFIGYLMARTPLAPQNAIGPFVGVQSHRFAQNRLWASAELGMLGTDFGTISPANPLIKLALNYSLPLQGFWEKWNAEFSYRHLELPATTPNGVTSTHSFYLGLGRAL